MPNYKVLISEKDNVELEFQEELQLNADNVEASLSNGLASDSVQGQLDELAANVFGDEFQVFESDGTSSTTSATYQNKINSTTTNLPSGDYIIMYSAEIGNENNNKSIICQARCLIGGTIVGQVEDRSSSPDDNAFVSFSGIKKLSLSGVTTVQIQYRRVKNSTATIRRARVVLWRVA